MLIYYMCGVVGLSISRKRAMKIAIRFTAKEELKAVPILMRHSPGMMLPGDIYVLSEEAVAALREAGVRFTEVTSKVASPGLEGATTGERI
jgi:hypothetical protein